jgi:hypothetical protein
MNHNYIYEEIKLLMKCVECLLLLSSELFVFRFPISHTENYKVKVLNVTQFMYRCESRSDILKEEQRMSTECSGGRN